MKQMSEQEVGTELFNAIEALIGAINERIKNTPSVDHDSIRAEANDALYDAHSVVGHLEEIIFYLDEGGS
jgi:hypothetical protein